MSEYKANDYMVQCRVEDRQRIDRDVVAVLGTVEGRRLLTAMMGMGGVYGYSGHPDDSMQRLAYQAGRRDAAVDVLKVANRVAPELVLQAQMERTEVTAKRRQHYESLMRKSEEGEG